MDTKSYTDYQILKTIEQNSDLSQRLISKHTGINVSSINYALRQLIQKGYVKITNMNKKRILYHLTPSGLSQKGTLALNFFVRNYNLFSDVREIISQHLRQPELKGKNLAIFGLNEITEIVYLCIKNNEVKFLGLYEDNPALVGKKWLDGVVLHIDTLKNHNNTDYLIDTGSFSSADMLKLDILRPADFLKRKMRKRAESFSGNNETSPIELKIIGAADTVTGSCALLKAGEKSILIDCGLFQGNGENPNKNSDRFPFKPEEINYLLLTHVHIDHSGRIPQLIDQGFKGEILCHHATAELLPLLLEDGFKFNNHIKCKSTKKQLMEKVIEQSWGFGYNRWNRISKEIRFRLLDAGHILGSATIQLEINGEYLVFSGDIGNRNTGIIRDPVMPDRADILILESTYGGRNHAETDKKETFKEIIEKALGDNGKVLIPAFSVGRTQEIIYQLNDLVEKGELKNIPVFVDSPLGIEITALYQRHRECFDEETLRRLEAKDDPLDFKKLFAVEHYRDSVHIDDLKGPAIIIAGSGMCTGGRIINHLANLLEDKTTDVLFTGYQAEGTLGANILTFSKRENGYVVINGKKVFIKAAVHQISGFSAHADHEGLLEWVDGIRDKPHTIYLNHGEPAAQTGLKEGLLERFDNISVSPSPK